MSQTLGGGRGSSESNTKREAPERRKTKRNVRLSHGGKEKMCSLEVRVGGSHGMGLRKGEAWGRRTPGPEHRARLAHREELIETRSKPNTNSGNIVEGKREKAPKGTRAQGVPGVFHPLRKKGSQKGR